MHKKRSQWVKPLFPIRFRLGLYENLINVLHEGDLSAFKNFTRIPPELFNELKTNVGPLLEKKTPI